MNRGQRANRNLTTTRITSHFVARLMQLTLAERRYILIQVAKAVGVKKGGDSVSAKPPDGAVGGQTAARLR